MELSVVIPAFNEAKNVAELHKRLVASLKPYKYELIFVDDGSTDSTYEELLKLSKKDTSVKIIKFRRNFGQTAAWDAGFQHSKGNLIITIDADLQNDPKDIPKLINKFEEGYDVVSGWRYSRRDNFSKKIFSGISRFLRNLIIEDKIHDSGCSLKVYKRECLDDLVLQGEMHRYIAELLALQGYKIGEVKVNHLPRKFGKTKYNFIRLPKGFLDLLVVAFWQKYSSRPIHLFGGLGIIMSFFGLLTGGYLAVRKFVYHEAIANRPLLLLALLLLIVGIQFIIFGLIADILVRLYYRNNKKAYSIEHMILVK